MMDWHHGGPGITTDWNYDGLELRWTGIMVDPALRWTWRHDGLVMVDWDCGEW
ncbi:hypothetical protein [Paenibacillus lactis]|uniref:hypothetical protein n=1 Tax=Paenibacillus lactis TaxID=228574 RepID=UPI003D75AC9E